MQNASRPLLLLAVALAASASSCAVLTPPNVDGYQRKLASGTLSARLLPPEGRQLVIIGQQPDSADHEPPGVGLPGGVMLYAALGPDVERFAERLRDPQSAAVRFPDSALQIGLTMAGHLDTVNSGEFDQSIDELISTLAQTRRPVYLRFGFEFDGEWNHYDPVGFRQAWVRFRARLVASGATNIAMVWHSAAFCGGTYQGHPSWQWYPGDAAVDWIGISWFRGESCDYVMARNMVDFARERHKPLMIAESTPHGYDLANLRQSWDGHRFASRSASEIWDEWFSPYFRFIEHNADVVRAISYINDDWDATERWGPPYREGYWGNARLDANPSIASRWEREMRGKRWLRSGPGLTRMLLER